MSKVIIKDVVMSKTDYRHLRKHLSTINGQPTSPRSLPSTAAVCAALQDIGR